VSLGVVIKGPEGVVLAADSRITLEARRGNDPPVTMNFDNATKLLAFSKPHSFVGAVTYGAAVMGGQRTAHSYVPEFELSLQGVEGPLPVKDHAKRLSDFFMSRWKETKSPDSGPGMSFVVGGYDPRAAYGSVFVFNVPNQPDPQPRNAGEGEFGMTWGGQREIATRLIHGFDPALAQALAEKLKLDEQQMEEIFKEVRRNLPFPIPYAALPLQDCIDLATFLIRSTILFQNVAVGVRGVGGPIDVAVITRTDGLRFVQRKVIRGEPSTPRRRYDVCDD